LVVGACAVVGCSDPGELELRAGSLAAGATVEGALPVLVFSRTEGFRHASIEDAVPAIEVMGASLGWTVDATEDPSVFSPQTLAGYRVVVFALTTGDVLDASQESAFEGYMAAGGGYVGIHSATDTEYDWSFYGDMLGAYFDGHPAPQDATMTVTDATHPSTAHLGETWDRFDEWYNFAPNPSEDVDVLLNLEESTYDGGTMGALHPIAWTREFAGGRVFYTGGGHTSESYDEPDFLTHLQGGIVWAAGLGDGGGSTGTTTGDDGSTGDSEASTTTSSTGQTTAASGAATTETPGTDPAPDTTGGTGDASPQDGPSDDAAGCSCRTSPVNAPLFALLPLARIRRRRRSSRGARSDSTASAT
jgi:type 1 glutamine amidotransferase